MKLLFVIFTIVAVVTFNSATLFAESNDELITQCNDKNDVDACLEVAEKYVNDSDNINAFKYITKACDGGMMAACLAQGSLYKAGTGVKQSSKKAINSYSKVCNNKEMIGCVLIGSMYEYGEGVEIDFNKALQHYKLACDGGLTSACNGFKDLYEKECPTDSKENKKFCKKYK